MRVDIKRESLPLTVPTPLYSAIQIGTAENDLRSTFAVYLGLDKEMVSKLKQLSLDMNDRELQDNTSDKKRFGEGSYEEWYAKNRVPFALIHDGDKRLAALMWYGPKELGRKSMKHLTREEILGENVLEHVNTDWHTVSFRSYLPFRGKGVMKDFAKITMEVYLHYFPTVRLWTGTDRSNAASMALSKKLGFTIDESASNAERVSMVKTSD